MFVFKMDLFALSSTSWHVSILAELSHMTSNRISIKSNQIIFDETNKKVIIHKLDYE
jgi:hypothetical protein